MKSDYLKLNANILYSTLKTDELTHWEIQQNLVDRTIEDIKKLNEGGDPLLHTACLLGREHIGARRLLLVFFEDPTLRSLFGDPSYLDRHGWRPIDVLMRQNSYSVASMGWFILDDIIHEFGIQKREEAATLIQQ